MAVPRFRLREQPPCWARICSVDVERVIESGKAGATLNALVDELTFARASTADLRHAGYEAASTMVRLLQLTTEYLLHVQSSLSAELSSSREAHARSEDRATRLQSELERAVAVRDAERRQRRHYQALARCLASVACDDDGGGRSSSALRLARAVAGPTYPGRRAPLSGDENARDRFTADEAEYPAEPRPSDEDDDDTVSWRFPDV